MKDKVMAGLTVGLLADSVKLIFNYACFSFGFTKTVFWQIAATRFLNRDDLFKPIAYLIGAIVDLTTTAVLGVLFIFLLRLTGRAYLWIKGAGFGLVVWVGLFGTVLSQATATKLPSEPATILVAAIAHLIFGLSLALFTKLLVKPDSETWA